MPTIAAHKRKLQIGILVGISLSTLWFLAGYKEKQSSSVFLNLNEVVQEQTELYQDQENFGIPLRLIIPGISVNASVKKVGLTSDGAMDVPRNQDDVAWYQFGPHPGEIGSAVITGHFGVWVNGRGSVFDQLHSVQKGDKLYVEDENGTTSTFVVREMRRYEPDADATEIFTSTDGKAHLNLVTCDGDWNALSQSFSERLVVFTDKE